MQNDINTSISNAAKWSSITEIAARLFTPISNIILARLLTPDDFGMIATLTMVVSFAEIITDAGFPKYIIQHDFSNREALEDCTNIAFWTNLFFAFLMWGIIVLFSSQIAELVGCPGNGIAITIMGFDLPILAVSSIQIARFRRDFNFKSLFIVRVITSVAPLVVTVPLAMVFHSYWALVLGTLIKDFLNACILGKLSCWKPSLYYSIAKLKGMLSFTLWTVVENITSWLTGYIGTFIVGNALSIHFLGFYKTTMNTVNSYMGIITAAIIPLLFSALSRYQDNEDAFKYLFFKVQRMAALLLFPIAFGMYVYRQLATIILLGAQWVDTADFLGLWSLISGICIVMGQLNSEIYRSKGKPQISVLQQILQLAVLIPTLLWGVRQPYSMLTTSRAMVRLEGVVVSAIITQAVFKLRFSEVLINIWCPFFAAAIMALAGAVMRTVFDNVLWELLTVGFCVIIYAAVLLIIPAGRRLLAEIPVLRRVFHLKEIQT